jgi:hypothetical protein
MNLSKAHQEYFKATYPLIFSQEKNFYWDIGDGWFQLMDELCRDITVTCITRKITIPTCVQVKEKFGTFRFYLGASDGGIDGTEQDRRDIHTLISRASRISAVTCEEYGATGELRTGGWVQTRCDEHARN